LDGRKLVVDLCGSKSATFEERTNMESTTLSVQGNTEFDEDDLRQTFEDAVAIRIGSTKNIFTRKLVYKLFIVSHEIMRCSNSAI